MSGGRDFTKSPGTNKLFEKFSITKRLSLIVGFPNGKEYRLRGETLREFLWTLRSNKADVLLDEWVNKLNEYEERKKARGGDDDQ